MTLCRRCDRPQSEHSIGDQLCPGVLRFAEGEASIAALVKALKPFANVAEQIRKTGTDERWLEQVLFYMGDDNDPSKWSLTGRAFDRAYQAISKAPNE